MSNIRPKVIVVGCGIAGPVLAVFLKLKGYDPVIYERLAGPEDTGLSLCLQPNGLRVLDLIPGLFEKIQGKEIETMFHYSVVADHEGILAKSNVPVTVRETYHYPMMGVRRPALLRLLVETAENYGIPIFWEHQMTSLEQDDDSVTVHFANGVSDKASFVVGCDGLHSNTRASLFGNERADFTGVVQTGGISPRPASFRSDAIFANFYGNGVHLIAYACSPTHVSWAVTQQEPESKESWRGMDETRQRKFKEGPFSLLDFGAGELVKTADKIIKFGLYDRPELKTWHSGRVVLLGDAAHPTSPHLGQGANQAFEDVYHFIRLLTSLNPSASPPSTPVLEDIFTQYEQIRIPRTSALVKAARKGGELRTVRGLDACLQRNEKIRDMWKDDIAVLKNYRDTFDAPFSGESEI